MKHNEAFTEFWDFECPHCDRKFNIGRDEYYELVTYYGESGPYEIECPECEKVFWVKEVVDRDYYTGKTEEEAADWWRT